jgi:hypothetical protein
MNLDQIQRAMFHAVRQPLTPAEGMRATAPDGTSLRATAESIIRPNRRLTSFERLEIYNRQYWFRLLSALAEDFTGLRAIVGERKFEKLAVAYLCDHPSRAFTLRNLGSQLEKWLLAHLEYAPKVEHIAVDMVRLEWAEIEAFDNLALPPLSAEEMASLGEDPVIHLQPHLQLLDLAYPVDDLLLSVRRKEEDEGAASNAVLDRPRRARIRRTALPKAKKLYLAVHRSDNTVYFRQLEAAEFAILRVLRRGGPLSEAVDAADFAGSPVEEVSAQIQEWFAHWASLGWFCKAVEKGEAQ